MRNNRCVCPEGPGCVIYHPLPQVPCMSCHAASHLKQCPMAGEQVKCTGLTIACVQSPCSSLKKNPNLSKSVQICRNNQIAAPSQPLAKSVSMKSHLAVSNQWPNKVKCKSDKWFQGCVQTKPGAVAKKRVWSSHSFWSKPVRFSTWRFHLFQRSAVAAWRHTPAANHVFRGSNMKTVELRNLTQHDGSCENEKSMGGCITCETPTAAGPSSVEALPVWVWTQSKSLISTSKQYQKKPTDSLEGRLINHCLVGLYWCCLPLLQNKGPVGSR